MGSSPSILEWLNISWNLGKISLFFFSRKRVKFLSLSLFLRNESEMKMTGNWDREVKSEEKMSFTLFEKCKWKKNDSRSRSRNESEMKMTENRDREVKVKWKSFEIEIEKWNFSRIFENLKRTDFDLSERVHMEVISFRYVIC